MAVVVVVDLQQIQSKLMVLLMLLLFRRDYQILQTLMTSSLSYYWFQKVWRAGCQSRRS
jgi:hypothetical protein